MKTICVIPARGGSKGVPRKNIKELAGLPLIYYSINIALSVFGKAYVSTEDEEIASVARKYGAQVITRPIELASDTATDFDWLQHVCSKVDCENIVILRPTTPIRTESVIIEAIDKFLSVEGTSLRSAHEAPESPLKWFHKYGEHWLMNEHADKPRQDLPKIYIPNGYVDITKRTTINKGTAFGNDIISFITTPVTEIDTQKEFNYLEYLLRRKDE